MTSDTSTSGSGGTTAGSNSGGSASTSTAGTAGGTGDDVCQADASDGECDACTKASCCDPLSACFADPVCVCMTECAGGLADIAMCTMKCGTSETFTPLTQCVTVNCAAECI